MLQTNHRTFENLIATCDLLVVAGAVVLGGDLGWRVLGSTPTTLGGGAVLGQAAIAAACWLGMSWRLEFYQSRRAQRHLRELQTLFEVLLLGLGVASLIGVAVWGALAFQPLFTFPVAFAGIGSLRLGVRVLLRNLRFHGRNFRRVCIVGRGRAARELCQRLISNPHYGIRVVGSFYFSDRIAPPLDAVPCFGATSKLTSVLAQEPVDSVIVCPAIAARTGEVQEVFDACEEAGIACYFAPDFFTMRNLQSSVAWFGDLPALKFHRGGAGPFRFALKRAMDIGGSLAGLILGAPVMLACAAAIKLRDGGPVLFRQQRVGMQGKVFQCYKFRSMTTDADERKADLAALNEAEGGVVFKIRKDPRVTSVGRVLRKYSLDELPQLFNVLKGDMSLVGP
ncbi:MAG: sugar transferase, partial [Planctomycetes bacterium]|nr:sugar transferase [Planctomycetota bacterium]